MPRNNEDPDEMPRNSGYPDEIPRNSVDPDEMPRNSGDLDEMPRNAAFHLGLHCSFKYPFRGLQDTCIKVNALDNPYLVDWIINCWLNPVMNTVHRISPFNGIKIINGINYI